MQKIEKCGWCAFLYGLFLATACVFPIQVYAADAENGNYHLELCYDNTHMDYVSRVDSKEDGLLIPDGTAGDVGSGYHTTAESIYRQSGQEAAENDRTRKLQRFLYFVVFFVVAVLLAFIIMKIGSAIKRDQQKSDGGSDEPDMFPFEFETIPEERPEKIWQRQIREDIDAREREGKNTQTLKFRRVNESEYDLEVNELSYDMEIEYIDAGIEYIDL